MLRWKILKFLAAISAGILFFYHTAFDPLRKLLLARYDLRWSVNEERPERTHTIAFRNSAGDPSDAIQIEIEFPKGAVVDFEAADFQGGPRISFLQTVARSSYDTRFLRANRRRIMRLLDEHYSLRSLSQVEDTLRGNLVEQIRKSGYPAADTDWFLHWRDSHETQILRCGVANEGKGICQTEQQLEEWEYDMRGLNQEACRAWERATGISANFSQGYLAPNGKTIFGLLVRGHESKFLTIRYGADEIPPLKITRNHVQQSIKVALKDLEASRWKIVPWYEPLETLLAAFILVGLLLFAWAIHTSIQKLPTLELFNLAIQRLNPQAWKLARERREHWVEREFRSFCEVFGKPHLTESRAHLFQYVQDRLIRDHALYDLEFENKEELEKTMRKHLRDLVIRS